MEAGSRSRPGGVHQPVLLAETLEWLAPAAGAGFMVDGTLGLGGHAAAFLDQYPELTMLGIDVDQELLELARQRLARFGDRVQLAVGWCADALVAHAPAKADLRPADLRPADLRPADSGRYIDRFLLDLGVSLHHFHASGRGFSIRGDEPLDMRLDRQAPRTAADIVNEEPQTELANLLFELGGERRSRRIAAAIVASRRGQRIMTTAQLEQLIWQATSARERHGRIHPATRTFQALRIAVNDELGQLAAALHAGVARLRPLGRVAVISFHSLEDRIVKAFFRDSEQLRVLTAKPLQAGADERVANPPSRSARLRVAELSEAAA